MSFWGRKNKFVPIESQPAEMLKHQRYFEEGSFPTSFTLIFSSFLLKNMKYDTYFGEKGASYYFKK